MHSDDSYRVERHRVGHVDSSREPLDVLGLAIHGEIEDALSRLLSLLFGTDRLFPPFHIEFHLMCESVGAFLFVPSYPIRLSVDFLLLKLKQGSCQKSTSEMSQ